MVFSCGHMRAASTHQTLASWYYCGSIQLLVHDASVGAATSQTLRAQSISSDDLAEVAP
jgi:hypothetical protein